MNSYIKTANVIKAGGESMLEANVGTPKYTVAQTQQSLGARLDIYCSEVPTHDRDHQPSISPEA